MKAFVSKFHLLETPQLMALVAGEGEREKERNALIVDRDTGKVEEREWTDKDMSSHTIVGEKTYYGILGTISLLLGDYLIVVKERKQVEEYGIIPRKEAEILGHSVYKVVECELLPMFISKEEEMKGESYAEISQRHYEEQLLKDMLLTQVLNRGEFYYSPTYDLTNSKQRQAELLKGQKEETYISDIAHEKFFWNLSLSKSFRSAFSLSPSLSLSLSPSKWICVCIRGHVDIRREIEINKHQIDFYLISRMAWQYPGTRYNARGIDSNGQCVNTTETEQLIAYKPSGNYSTGPVHCCSYLQIRASIPLFWEQKVNLKYKPKMAFSIPANSKAHTESFRKHVRELKEAYGPTTCINLIDQKGAEKVVGEKFGEEFAKLGDSELKYIWFDFHRECRKMQYQNIEKLFAQIRREFDSYGYYSERIAKQGNAETVTVKLSQSGIYRTNCIDCLDRTNVCQAYFSRNMLARQLQEAGVFLSSSDAVSEYTVLDEVFRNVWANNADAVSTLYSGTPALKTDYTRTGKRSLRGALNDGWNSLVRYWLNNFRDGKRQDALELAVGKYTVDRRLPASQSPLALAAKEQRPVQVFRRVLSGMAAALAYSHYQGNISLGQELLLAGVWGASLYAYVKYFKWQLIDSPKFGGQKKLD